MSNNQFPQIDRAQAMKQLAYLGRKPEDKIHLRFFYHSTDPRKNGDKGRKLARLNWQQLERYQEEGRGVYVVVNIGGHNDNDISKTTAIFCEWDDLSLEEQALKWQTVGMPEPTFTVFSGDKSMQPYWCFEEGYSPSPEQWRELQTMLIQVMDADPSNKNLSRVFRLAGGWHVKPGREPVKTEIVQDSGVFYRWEELKQLLEEKLNQLQPEILPQQRTPLPRPQQQTDCQRVSNSDNFPMFLALSKNDRALIDGGAANYRNTEGAKLARNLIGTAARLNYLGVNFSGDPYQLFLDYCRRCHQGDGWNQKEWDSIWNKAEKSNPSATLSDDAIRNCIAAWAKQDKRINTIASTLQHKGSNAGVGFDIIDQKPDGLSTAELEARIDQLIADDLPQSKLEALIPEIAKLSDRTSNDVRQLFKAKLVDVERVEDKLEAGNILPSLVEIRSHRINPTRLLWGDCGTLAGHLEDTAASMPTAVEFLLTTLIPVAGSRIGTSSRVVVKASANYIQPAIYRSVIVARSGAKKTPAQKAIVEPLNELEAEAYIRYEQELAEYEQQMELWKGEGDKPCKPIRKRYIVTDNTIEAKIRIHAENGRGFLIYQDEWSAHFKARNKYRNGKGDDAENELTEFNGGSLSKDRVKESIYLPSSAISRTGSTQWEVLKELMGAHEDPTGEMARWLFDAAESPPAYIDLISSEASRESGLSECLKRLYTGLERLPAQDYGLSQEAKILFQNWQHKLIDWTLEENQPLLKVAYAKFESYGARLALWLHLVNSVLAGNLNPESLISDRTMTAAIEWTNYFIGQLRLICAHNSPQQVLSGHLLKIKEIAESRPNKPISARDLQSIDRAFKQLSANEIRSMFKTISSTVENLTLVGTGAKLKIMYIPPPALGSSGNTDSPSPPSSPSSPGSSNGSAPSSSSKVLTSAERSAEMPGKPPSVACTPTSKVLTDCQQSETHTQQGVEQSADSADNKKQNSSRSPSSPGSSNGSSPSTFSKVLTNADKVLTDCQQSSAHTQQGVEESADSADSANKKNQNSATGEQNADGQKEAKQLSLQLVPEEPQSAAGVARTASPVPASAVALPPSPVLTEPTNLESQRILDELASNFPIGCTVRRLDEDAEGVVIKHWDTGRRITYKLPSGDVDFCPSSKLVLI